MFTGIIRQFGEVNQLSFHGPMARVQIETPLDVSDVSLGDSIAVNGVCLTAVAIEKSKPALITFDIGPETLDCTSLAALRTSECVHLEKALQLSDRIHGHLLQGHVDGVGIIVHKEMQGESLVLKIAAPQEILRLCIPKGSIGVDGVSLTINKIHAGSFELCLIPHTLLLTNFAKYEIGRRVNLENDVIGKYVYEILLKHNPKDEGISWDLLMKNGFLGNDSKSGTPL